MADDADIAELGPIDWIVVECPGSEFYGEIAPELAALQDHGIIRILDLVIVKKDDDGAWRYAHGSTPSSGRLRGGRAGRPHGHHRGHSRGRGAWRQPPDRSARRSSGSSPLTFRPTPRPLTGHRQHE